MTWWRAAFGTFMISRPNLQYNDWMELDGWIEGNSQTPFSMQMNAGCTGKGVQCIWYMVHRMHSVWNA